MVDAIGRWSSSFRFWSKRFLFVFSVAAILTALAHSLPFSHIEESIQNQIAIANGQVLHFDGKETTIPAFYNRILIPHILMGMKTLTPNASWIQIFLIFRFFEFFVCFYLLYVSIERRGNNLKQDPFGLLSAIALSFIPSLSYPWAVPSDILDLTLSYFVFLAVLENRFWQAFGIALITCVNRETGAFGAILYGSVYFLKVPFQRWILRLLLLAFVPYTVAVVIRMYQLQLPWGETGQMYIGIPFNVNRLLEWLAKPNPIGWPVLDLAMMYIPLHIFLQRTAVAERMRIFGALIIVFVITSVFGILAESRVLVPCLALIFAGIVHQPIPKAVNGYHPGPLGKRRTMTA